MQRIATWRKQFSWRMLLMRTVINALALLVTAALVPNIYFVDRTLVSWLLVAIGLGVLNAVIKPIIQFATLRFIFATYGVILALINGIILWLLSVLMSARFTVDGILWALVGGAVIGIVSALLENLFGLTPPIVSEKYPELRQRIKDRETGSVEAHITQSAIERTAAPKVDAQALVSETEAAAAVLAVVGEAGDAPSESIAGEAAAQPVDPEQLTKLPAEQEA